MDSRMIFRGAISRRGLLVGGGACAAMGASLAAAEPILVTATGLDTQPWFLDGDRELDLGQVFQATRKAGKRLAVMWELKGCPYCRRTHMVNFAQPQISDFIKAHFDILPLDIVGARMVTDFDGAALSEKQLAAKYGVRVTPTFQFFTDAADGLANVPADKREVMRIPGYLVPDDFLTIFRFVQEKAYETKSLRDFLKTNRG